MVYSRRFVCLAASRKNLGLCVAGKELPDDRLGDWIRPVSALPKGELHPEHCRCADGGSPVLLDIFEVPFDRPNPQGYQVENHLVDDSIPWQRVGPFSVGRVAELRDHPGELWLNEDSSGNGLNDRVVEAVANAQIRSSLVLIQPEDLRIEVRREYENRKKVRASFSYEGVRYRLKVTDPVVEKTRLAGPEGDYRVGDGTASLCISLGEPFRGYCYKLVAAVIPHEGD